MCCWQSFSIPKAFGNHKCINCFATGGFIENLTYEEFIKYKKTSYAVVRCIEIIGELQKTSPRHYGLYDKTTLGEEL